MKRYIKASTSKPTLDNIRTEWEEFDDGSGIKFTVYSGEDEVVFEEVFDYQDVDPDAIPESAAELAIISLSQQYELTDDVISALQDN